MALQFGVALPEDMSLILSTHVQWFTTACKPSSRGSIVPFWPCEHYPHMRTHIHKHNFKIKIKSYKHSRGVLFRIPHQLLTCLFAHPFVQPFNNLKMLAENLFFARMPLQTVNKTSLFVGFKIHLQLSPRCCPMCATSLQSNCLYRHQTAVVTSLSCSAQA